MAGGEKGGGKGLPSYGLATVATGSMWHFIKGRRRHDLNGEFRVLAPFGLAGWLAGWLAFLGVSLGEQTQPPFPVRGMPHLKCKRQLIINAPNQLHFVPDRALNKPTKFEPFWVWKLRGFRMQLFVPKISQETRRFSS